MFRRTVARSALVLTAALAAVSATGLADVASAASAAPNRAVTVTQQKSADKASVTAGRLLDFSTQPAPGGGRPS
jgi:hypothetical protein